jgi:DNA-binding transcriptional LysR family regulator
VLEGDPLSGRELAAFVAAVEARSVQGAADALNLTQSAVTKRLQALERRLDRALLHRDRRGVVPNRAGRVLYPEAKQALAALRRAATCLEDDAAAPELRIGASHTIGEFLLPAWLAGFRATGQDVVAQVEIIQSPAVLRAVREGRVDVGFVEGLDASDDLDALVLERDEIVVVVAPSHRWAGSPEVPALALASEPFFSRERGSGTRAVAADRLAEVGVRLEPVLEVASSQSLKRSVVRSGFTLLSRRAVEEELGAGTLCALRVVGVDLHRDLRAVRTKQGLDAPIARAWWTWLRSLPSSEVS